MATERAGGCTGNHFGRRELLRLGALSFLGIDLGQYLEAAAATPTGTGKARAESCILLWLDGGPSQVDTWDPKPNSAFRPIGTRVPGMQISELFPRVAREMDKISIVRSVRSEENNHGTAHHYAMTGHRPNPAMKFPSLGSIVTKEKGGRGAVPPYVMAPRMNPAYEEHFRAHMLGPECDPMSVSSAKGDSGAEADAKIAPEFAVPDLALPPSVTAGAMDDRRTFLGIVDRRYRRAVEQAEQCEADAFREKAWQMLLAPGVRKAFDLSEESDRTRDAYGRNVVGQSTLLARRLVAAGSRFVTASASGGWDTHTGHDRTVRDKLAHPIDQTLAALLGDLAERGLLETTIVLVMGEFGRTPDYNAKAGRDHWPNCWSILIGGGGIAGGRIVGASDARGAEVADRLVTIGDVFATVYKAFGIDWNKLYVHPIGRPLKIANSINDVTGKPIDELF